MSACGYEFICLNWIISLKVQKMSWTLDGKIRIHARLSDTSHVYIDQFPSLHFKDWDEVSVSKGSKNISHINKISLCTMDYQINLLVSLWFLLCLFCCHLGRICDLYFRQKYWKSFYSCDNNILFGHEIIQGIQQATSIFFFLLWGIEVGIERKHILHYWVAQVSCSLT